MAKPNSIWGRGKNPASHLSGSRNGNWKGGRSITEHGYVLVRVGKDHPLADVRGYAYEHRLTAFNAGELDARTTRHVHHDDEVTTHNEIENLETLTPAWHRFLHRKPGCKLRRPDQRNRIVHCACGCGATFRRFDGTGRPRRFVSGHNGRL